MKEEKQYSIKEYISEIDDVIDERKNVNFIATIIKIKKVEINKAIIVELNLKDDSGTILGVFVGKKNNSDAPSKVLNKTILQLLKLIKLEITPFDPNSIKERKYFKLVYLCVFIFEST